MKRSLTFSVILALILTIHLYAQAAAKKVDPGGPVPLEWTFPTNQESNISGFKLYTAPTATGPFVFNGSAIAPNLRTVTVPATFAPNTLRIFYRITAFKTAGTETAESAPPVAADREVEMNVPSPTGLLVK